MPVDLPAVLDALCARTGARSARVVDGRVGAVVAVSGDPGTADPVDGPSAVARLLHESGPDPRTADRGDVCVTTPHSVHLLRPVAGAPEAFVHLRLAGDGEVDRARSTLAEPLLHELVRSALHGTDPRPDAVLAPGSGDGRAGESRARATVPGLRTAGDARAARNPTVTLPAQVPPPGAGPAGGGGPAPAPRRGGPPVPLRRSRRPGTRVPVAAAPTGRVDPAAETVRLAAVRPADSGPAAAAPAVGAAATAAASPAATARTATAAPSSAATPITGRPAAASPVPAPPVAGPVAPADSADQPALAVLAGRPRLRDATLAAAAVAGLAAALPRRTPGRVVTGTGRVSGLPRLHWTEDPGTLHRVLGGLHRLN